MPSSNRVILGSDLLDWDVSIQVERPRNHLLGDRAQRLSVGPQGRKFAQTLLAQFGEPLLRCSNADNRRKGRLIPFAAARLSALAGRGFAEDIENVIGDLKSQTEGSAKARDAFDLRRLGARHLRAQAQRSANQCTGFADMDVLDYADIDSALFGL